MNKENFYSDDGVYYMVRCDKCGKENHAFYVAKGKCIWCGFDKRKEDKKAKERERWHKRYSNPEFREKEKVRSRERNRKYYREHYGTDEHYTEVKRKARQRYIEKHREET